jgi:hypothetical protein
MLNEGQPFLRDSATEQSPFSAGMRPATSAPQQQCHASDGQ